MIKNKFSAIHDKITLAAPHGQPRGFDCRTGRKKWQFDVIPQDARDPAFETWENGTDGIAGGNVWAPISGDSETGKTDKIKQIHYTHSLTC